MNRINWSHRQRKVFFIHDVKILKRVHKHKRSRLKKKTFESSARLRVMNPYMLWHSLNCLISVVVTHQDVKLLPQLHIAARAHANKLLLLLLLFLAHIFPKSISSACFLRSRVKVAWRTNGKNAGEHFLLSSGCPRSLLCNFSFTLFAHWGWTEGQVWNFLILTFPKMHQKREPPNMWL